MIKNLISLSIEIEGLLRVLDENPSAEAKDLLEEKFEQFSQIFYSEIPSIEIARKEPIEPKAEPTEVAETPQPVDTPEVVETVAVCEESTTPVTETAPEVPDNPIIDEPIDFTDLSESAPDTIKVDEMLSRREARDLTRAFTLNDKFRFTRELFDGNKSLFADTLNMIMAMESFDEANEYLVSDLGIDPESEAGTDFMAIITNHFNGR